MGLVGDLDLIRWRAIALAKAGPGKDLRVHPRWRVRLCRAMVYSQAA
jgi:hypothetical protein